MSKRRDAEIVENNVKVMEGFPPEAPVQKTRSAKQTEFPMDINEFCTQLSQSDNRVEIIGAFHSEECVQGRRKDMKSAYMKRFQEFCTRPV